MTTTPELGVIERVDLRSVWANEATSFTPWLAENISKLGESLCMDLEVEQREAPVGSFSLDLLVRDVDSERVVVIENQFEETDHDHLGKLITYAAGYEAGIIVWISEEFNEKHRQALDWLNERSDQNTKFFGVKIELWKIGNSFPAPHFTLIVSPNEWQRESKRNLLERKISARDIKYQVFFQQLLDKLYEMDFCKVRKAQPTFQCRFSSGFGSTYTYRAGFAIGEKARVEMYIDSGDTSRNKLLFDNICLRKEEIEIHFGNDLRWERLDDKQGSRIATYREGTIDDEDSTLEDIRSWMIDNLVQFKQNFGKILEEIEQVTAST